MLVELFKRTSKFSASDVPMKFSPALDEPAVPELVPVLPVVSHPICPVGLDVDETIVLLLKAYYSCVEGEETINKTKEENQIKFRISYLYCFCLFIPLHLRCWI